jgi:sugar lactone lactonase YvrE
MIATLALCISVASAQPLDSLPVRIDDVPPTLVLASALTPPAAPSAPAPDLAANDLLKELVDPGTPEKIASGMKFNEGPVWVPTKDGKPGYLLFSDIPSDTIFRLDPPKSGETATPIEHRKPSGHSNGLFLDKDGRLVICEHEGRITRIEPDGSLAVLAAEWEGKSLNSPNDLCISSDGAIYFTDPTYGMNKSLGKERAMALDFRGVYRIDYNGKLNLLTRDLATPNGVCLSPDQKTLYVTNHSKGEIWAYTLKGKETPEAGKLIATTKIGSRSAGADGIRADETGNLYVAGRGGIHVFKPSGESIGLIAIEESPTNLVFGDDDRKTIYATGGGGSIYRIRVKIAGALK